MSRVPEPAELAEDLQRLERAIELGAQSTRDAIDRLIREIKEEYVRKEAFALTIASVKKDIDAEASRVGKLEDRHTWIARTAVTALVLPILVTVVAAIILAGVTL